MTVDATKPANGDFISTHAEVIRTANTDINNIWSALGSISAIPIFKDLSISGVGDQDLNTDNTNLNDVFLEIVRIENPSGNAGIRSIINGRSGMIKIFYVNEDINTLTFLHDDSGGIGVGSKGVLKLNGEVDLASARYDIIAFMNFGGDGGGSEDGVWREVFRTLWYS